MSQRKSGLVDGNTIFDSNGSMLVVTVLFVALVVISIMAFASHRENQQIKKAFNDERNALKDERDDYYNDAVRCHVAELEGLFWVDGHPVNTKRTVVTVDAGLTWFYGEIDGERGSIATRSNRWPVFDRLERIEDKEVLERCRYDYHKKWELPPSWSAESVMYYERKR